MLSTVVEDVAHAANNPLPELVAKLPDDLTFAIFDQVAMLFDARALTQSAPSAMSIGGPDVSAPRRAGAGRGFVPCARLERFLGLLRSAFRIRLRLAYPA